MVNDLRASYGLAPYTVDPWIMAYAQEHAEHMAPLDSGTHIHSDGQLPTAYGLKENVAGGNIGIVTIAVIVYEIWGPSWGHLRTMIGYVDGEVGAGMAYSASDQVYYALNVRAGAEAPIAIPGQATANITPFIPIITSTADEKGAVYHMVAHGQTLWSIAATYGVTVDGLRQLNGMAGDATLIAVGQLLLIQKASSKGLSGTNVMITDTLVNTWIPVKIGVSPSIKTTQL